MIGSIVEYLYAPDDPEAVVEKMAAPTTRIVSLTVTEGGYNFSAITGEFDADNPAIVADLAPGAVPATTFGLVVEALARRRERGLPPFTIMSCDNIAGNGHIARETFTAFARLRDPGLAAWIDPSGAFPNSMVDRITPATTDRTGQRGRHSGSAIDDGWPVVCEPFTQWVLEDDFASGRPAFERVGVQVVDDVEPYELMKLRLLNASHQALCYFGYLSGYRLVHEVTQDPAFAKFLLRLHEPRGQPTLRPVPGVDLAEYERDAASSGSPTRRPRHRRAAVRGILGSNPQVAAAGGPAQLAPTVRSARPRRSWRAGPATPRAVDEQGGTDRHRRPAARHPDPDRPAPTSGADRVHREPRPCSAT